MSTRIGMRNVMKNPPTLKWRADGDANFYTLSMSDHWYARVQLNGELTAQQQVAIMQRITDAMNNTPTSTDYWRHPMPEDQARSVLGDSHFEYSMRQGMDFCRRMKRSAWNCNEPEMYGAYDAAERVYLAMAFKASQEVPSDDEVHGGDDMMGASG